jgi:hypothetical protein
VKATFPGFILHTTSALLPKTASLGVTLPQAHGPSHVASGTMPNASVQGLPSKRGLLKLKL